MFTYDQVISSKQRFLFVTAHPDDAVISFGGLIHQLRKDDKEVFVLVATNGARGSRENVISESELAQQRLQEEEQCLEILGVEKDHFFCLNYLDGEIESDLKLIGEIAKHIRQCKADLVATHEPSFQYLPTYAKDGFFVQHRDHRKLGEAVIDAVYPFSRDRSFFPEHASENIEPHSVYDILLTDERGCNFEFDFTDAIETKKQAMCAHKSQLTEETIEKLIIDSTFYGKHLEKFNYLKLLW